jgi:hypothetical protein
MRRRSLAALGSALAIAVAVAPDATAQNPDWPPTSPVTPTDLEDSATWPDDPGYGGNWNYWSWVPNVAEARETFRADESALGSGTWADMAWQFSAGDQSVVIAVLDSGIKWDEGDLVNQYYINQAELEASGLDARCLPTPPAGHTGDPIDVDGDGYLTMRDYTFGHDDTEVMAIVAALDDDGNDNGIADPGDLITICSDGNDDDGNGYEDDISGWDTYADDNDPQDDNRYGHGTGEARWSAAAGNDGRGDIGQCPRCRVLMVRTGDSFIVDAQDYAQSVVFSVDSGARIVQEALGSINHTTFMRRAQDYAYANDVLIVASAADENSYHHNFPGTSNHTLYVHAIQFAGPNHERADSYLAFNNCTNYGGQLVLSAPGTGCSSEATGVTAGVAGVVYASAIAAGRPGGPVDPPLSAEELRQLILMNAHDIDVPESQPDHPQYNSFYYPSVEGWDQRFGYGRVNAYQAVVAVREGRIPPEVDIVYPDWFRPIYPAQTPSITLRGKIDARRAPAFDWVIEWAAGIEPTDAEFTTLASGTDATDAIEGDLVTWDISGLEIDNADDGPHNKYTVTVRIRVTAKYGDPVGDVVGEQRRVFAILDDPDLLPGFPIALGVRNVADEFPGASGEGGAKLADIDGDDDLEIVYADADGLLHVIRADATELAGYPIKLGTLRGFDASHPYDVLGSRAYASGAIPTDDLASSVVLGVPAIGDLDGDGTVEIVVPTMEGDVYAFHGPDGSTVDGFPIALPEVPSGDPLRMGPMRPGSAIERAIVPAPVLYDLDDDDRLETIVSGSDGNVYVFRFDGSVQPGFPVEITAPQLWTDPSQAAPGRIVTPAAVGDADGDGIPDLAFGSNETGSDSNQGAVHLIHGDGTLHAGGAFHANWPVLVSSFMFYPFVGEGVTSPVSMADVNGDGRPDIAAAGQAGLVQVWDAIQPMRPGGRDAETIIVLDSGHHGPLTDVPGADRPLLNTFAAGSFGDMDGDSVPEYVTGGAGLGLGLSLAGGWQNQPFAHQIGAWRTRAYDGQRCRPGLGCQLEGFPREIEDYLFFVNPTIADVDGDSYAEVVVGSAGYWVRAWNACGEEAAGFPKFAGGWLTSSPAVGDIDGDGLLEAVVTTRSGYMFAWNLTGPAGGALPWPEYRHDNHNTGNYESPLSQPGMPTTATQPLVCDVPVIDGGVGDAAVGDAGTGEGGVVGGGGCDCRVARSGGPGGGAAWALAACVAVLMAGRRRRR